MFSIFSKSSLSISKSLKYNSIVNRNQQLKSFSTSTTTNTTTNWTAQRIRGYEGNIWAILTPLAQQHKAVNLGQGFPNFEPPAFLLEATKKALDNKIVQYTRYQGHLRTVNAIGEHYSKKLNRHINPLTQVAITVGATEGLFSTIVALVNPGDEVILIEPFYDTYPQNVSIAGGVAKYLSLKPTPNCTSAADWKLDFDELERTITKKTRMLVVNNPQNVPGKVWSEEELKKIAALSQKHNFLVLADQVYDVMTYDGIKPAHIATFPGMWDRTITLGSAGKSFSVTGFKLGWVVANEQIISAISTVHQNVSFCVASPLQEGLGEAFELINKGNPYFTELRDDLEKKRNKLATILKDVSLNPVIPQGSYFMLADFSKIPEKHYVKSESKEAKDLQFCRWLTSEIGVAAIPPSAFYSNEARQGTNKFARFCFCKTDQTIDDAAVRLQKLKNYL